MTSFIIADSQPVARLIHAAPADACRFGFEKSREALDANVEFNLVNARKGKVSNAAKWQDWEVKNGVELPLAAKLNLDRDDQFIII